MKVVTPFRPFEPESPAHRKLGSFDWLAAVRMLRASVERSCGCRTFILTDAAYQPPSAYAEWGERDVYNLPTTASRLMPWIVEASLRYLESDAFDEDTVFISPDTLVLKDLRFGFAADLGVIVRTREKFAASKPILNSVQWWAHAAKPRLVAFYREALALAEGLEEGDLRWGGDTVPLVRLLEPVTAGLSERSGLSVYGWVRASTLATVSSADIYRMDEGRAPMPTLCPLVDFKYLRKHYMQKYFDRTIGVPA